MTATTGQVLKAFAYLDEMIDGLQKRILAGASIKKTDPPVEQAFDYRLAVNTLAAYDTMRKALAQIFREDAADPEDTLEPMPEGEDE